jgi:hypothetical protein
MQFCALDDAHIFLVEAKGLPSIPSASQRLHLCLRACILLSWVGLEDGLDCTVEGWGARGRTFKSLPIKLKVRMLGFLLPLSERPQIDAEFDRLRKIRNHLAHPRAKEIAPALTLNDAEQTFQFCLKILRAIKTYRLAIRSPEATFRVSAAAPILREAQKTPPARERRPNTVSAPARKSAAL